MLQCEQEQPIACDEKIVDAAIQSLIRELPPGRAEFLCGAGAGAGAPILGKRKRRQVRCHLSFLGFNLDKYVNIDHVLQWLMHTT